MQNAKSPREIKAVHSVVKAIMICIVGIGYGWVCNLLWVKICYISFEILKIGVLLTSFIEI